MRPVVLLAVAVLVASAAGLPAAGSAATPSPAWRIDGAGQPSHFIPDLTDGSNYYTVHFTNVGGAATDGSTISVTQTLPAGFAFDPNPASAVIAGQSGITTDSFPTPMPCDPGPPVTCEIDHTVVPGERLNVLVPLDTPASGPPVISSQVSVSGGGATPVSTTIETPFSGTPALFRIDYLSSALTGPNGGPVSQAGSHPYSYRLAFGLTTRRKADGGTYPAEGLRRVTASLPPGFVVNPAATARCTEVELETHVCPDEAAVGHIQVSLSIFGFVGGAGVDVPLYNMVSPPGSPASLGFEIIGLGVFPHILGDVDPSGGYSLRAQTDDIPEYGGAMELTAELWGDPSDPSHNRNRGSCAIGGTYLDNSCPVPPTVPFLTLPSACSAPLETGVAVTSWQTGATDTKTAAATDAAGVPTPVTGCDQLDFDPDIDLDPTTNEADSSSGMDVDLTVPQDGLLDHDELAPAHLKRAVVELPEGMALNPAAAAGLEACTTAQIGLTSESPIRFDDSDPTCLDGSKIGTALVTTPLLDDPIPGSLYLADPEDNPFDTLLSGYIVAQGSGVLLKLAGRFDTDPDTGQITATFDNNPQLPFSSFKLHFKGGDRGVLVTPPECGTYEVESEMSPWSAADPDNPTPAEIVTDTDSFDVTTGPNGGPCPDYLDPARFTPTLSAGTQSAQAGASSPFNLRIARPDGQQSIKQIHVDLPPGLVAKLAGVPRCAQSQIVPGVNGSTNCPAGSQIGVANIGAGAGDTPYFLADQPVYLTEGYGGAPYGIAIDSNAVAGPFDLGHVVVRSTLNVDKDDAQVHIDSEQLPRIIEGIPLHIRDIRVNVNKPGFIQAPTNCSPMAVTGTVTGGGEDYNDTAPDASDDATVPISSPFQVSGCGSLPFSPKLSGFILNGQDGIHRSDHPNLQFSLAGTPGQANIAAVAVTLPSSFQIDQANLGNICSETQLIQTQCAGRNTVGLASATTPLLDSALVGPVYAVSGSGGLPKLAVILNGPPTDPLNLLVRGVTDTVGAQIRNTFPFVPDAPVSGFDLTLNGGPAGYLVNNQNLCDGTGDLSKAQRKKLKKIDNKNARKRARARMLRLTGIAAQALFTAQNGDTLTQQVPISADCPVAKGKGKGKKSKRSGKGKR